MERRKRGRRRRLVAFVVLSVVMVWMAGCAVGQSYGLSSLMSMKQEEKHAEEMLGTGMPGDEGSTDESEAAGDDSHAEPPGIVIDAGGVTEGDTAVFVPGEDELDPNHGILTPGSDSDGGGNATEAAHGDGQPESAVDSDDALNDGSEYDSAPIVGESDTEETSESAEEEKAMPEDERKLAALTFDDGPDPKYTTAILDILKEKGVKATFFVVGTQVEKYPEILQRIEEEGHAVGNHSYSHKDLSKLAKPGIQQQVDRTDEAIEAELGYVPELFRAPYGAVSDTLEAVLENENRRLVGWTVDTRDWAGTPITDMREMIRKETGANGIILMHSFGGKHIRNTVEMLPDVIDDLHNLGFTLVTVDQIPE
ncbi:polysaccharide deacetylase family protein [Paenibacillus soyae]|uniref:Polysaccharide deacetylase family protein n=1 Tax=Paenibacillus soyae TaxID=2969249 RepID=A0A9X2MVS6_9BACL|nr:polysaccharide deacetylase family protein [Paenibacillus soyae]MCR2804522.1 polysaccharide deacetylase family protein [Paenibacillus soyae]